VSRGSVAVKIGLLSVAVPAAGFALGWLLQATIPGCKCDTGAGCHGCAELNELIAFLLFGGFAGTLLAAFTLLPACLLVAVLLSIFGKPQPKSVDPQASDDAIVAALRSYRAGQPVTEKCGLCGSTLEVSSGEHKTAARLAPLAVKCSCGKSNGTYEFTSHSA
jgi:hypothetical protein